MSNMSQLHAELCERNGGVDPNDFDRDYTDGDRYDDWRQEQMAEQSAAEHDAFVGPPTPLQRYDPEPPF